jgi:hypothetical protein
MHSTVRLTSLLLVFAACSSNNSTVFEPETDAGIVVTDVRTGDVVPIPVRETGVAMNCSEAAQLVYVLSDRNELYSFRPNMRQFTRIGTLRCPTMMQPNSMAVDRNAVAWVNYVQAGPGGDEVGAMFRVSTSDASCVSASPLPLSPGFFRVGMGFSTAGVDSTDETLFLSATPSSLGGTGDGLARFDRMLNRLAPIGQFSGMFSGQSAELTGTGDGRLYGFFTTTPVQVAQINKNTGAVINATPLPGVERPSAWAFSFWGGDFYLYTAPSQLDGRTTNVTRYRPSDGSIDVRYMTEIGFRIVGAGVSTCAPIAPPP